MPKRVKCISLKRTPLDAPDPELVLGAFYTVVDEDDRTIADETPFLVVRSPEGVDLERPRHMFGPILTGKKPKPTPTIGLVSTVGTQAQVLRHWLDDCAFERKTDGKVVRPSELKRQGYRYATILFNRRTNVTTLTIR